MKQCIFNPGFKKMLHICSICSVFVIYLTDCDAQYRPSLFFREDWKETPAATHITQEHVANKDLVLGFYGPGCDSLRKSHHDTPVDDPYYVWSGLCQGNWVVTLKSKKSYVDLTGNAKIVWRSKQSGFRCLHLVLKLADGTWLVSNQCDGPSKDWRLHEFNIMDITWYTLNIKLVIEMKSVNNVNLLKVDEIGFTDLMTGGGTDSSSRLDWIEVYGKSVER